jgi:hypothetical protein
MLLKLWNIIRAGLIFRGLLAIVGLFLCIIEEEGNMFYRYFDWYNKQKERKKILLVVLSVTVGSVSLNFPRHNTNIYILFFRTVVYLFFTLLHPIGEFVYAWKKRKLQKALDILDRNSWLSE